MLFNYCNDCSLDSEVAILIISITVFYFAYFHFVFMVTLYFGSIISKLLSELDCNMHAVRKQK